jgi:hypothetical protein
VFNIFAIVVESFSYEWNVRAYNPKIVTDVSEKHAASLFTLEETLDGENGGSSVFRNVSKDLPNPTVSKARIA